MPDSFPASSHWIFSITQKHRDRYSHPMDGNWAQVTQPANGRMAGLQYKHGEVWLQTPCSSHCAVLLLLQKVPWLKQVLILELRTITFPFSFLWRAEKLSIYTILAEYAWDNLPPRQFFLPNHGSRSTPPSRNFQKTCSVCSLIMFSN